MRRTVISIITAIALLITTSIVPVAYAKENKNIFTDANTIGQNGKLLDDNLILQDTDLVVSESASKSNKKQNAIGYYKKETIVEKSALMKKQFIDYHTKSWAKVSEYSINESIGLKGTLVYKNVSLTLSMSKSISMKFKANQKRYSKIAGYADVRVYKIKVEEFVGGAQTPFKTSYKYEVKYEDTYLEVAYKN